MALRVLYHGTNSENAKKICKGINVKRGNEKTDFGKGFYTTDNFKTATIWDYNRKNRRYRYNYDIKGTDEKRSDVRKFRQNLKLELSLANRLSYRASD